MDSQQTDAEKLLDEEARQVVYSNKIDSFKNRWSDDYLNELASDYSGSSLVDKLNNALGQIATIKDAGFSVEELNDTKQLIMKFIEDALNDPAREMTQVQLTIDRVGRSINMDWNNEDGTPKSLEQLHKEDAARTKKEFEEKYPTAVRSQQQLSEIEKYSKRRSREIDLEFETKYPNAPVSDKTLKSETAK